MEQNSSKEPTPNLREDIFLELYDTVKEKLGEFYLDKPITLAEMSTLLVPVLTSIIRDHVDCLENLTVEQKHEAFAEAIGYIIGMLKEMAILKIDRFDSTKYFNKS